jgi:hypothetical protein
MKKHLISAILLFVLSSEYSYPTPSTQIWIPSTDFQKWKTIHLGLDNFIRTERTNGVRGAGMFDLGLTTGFLPFEKIQGEIGVDYLSMGDSNYDNYPVYFNAKIGMPEGAMFKGSPAIAIGVYNIGLKKNLTDFNILYGVVAKTIPVFGRVTFGYYAGNKKVLVDENLNRANTGLLLSWDRTMSEISDKLWLAVDYQGGKNYLGALNIGASWAFSKNVSVILGYGIYNNKNAYYNTGNQNASTFTAQVDINF